MIQCAEDSAQHAAVCSVALGAGIALLPVLLWYQSSQLPLPFLAMTQTLLLVSIPEYRATALPVCSTHSLEG